MNYSSGNALLEAMTIFPCLNLTKRPNWAWKFLTAALWKTAVIPFCLSTKLGDTVLFGQVYVIQVPKYSVFCKVGKYVPKYLNVDLNIIFCILFGVQVAKLYHKLAVISFQIFTNIILEFYWLRLTFKIYLFNFCKYNRCKMNTYILSSLLELCRFKHNV